jgi:hypothetical protein
MESSIGGTVAQPGVGGPLPAGRVGVRPPRWWFVVVPCLLALPAAGFGLLVNAVASMFNCFDTCGGYTGWLSSPAGENTLAVAELVVGVAAIVSLIVGLLVPGWRRVLGLTGWAACLLACAGLGLSYWRPL